MAPMRPAGAKSKRNRVGQDADHRKRLQISGLEPRSQHERTACDVGWDDEAAGETDPEHRLTSERLRQWGMHMHVDHVFDLVPFWRRAVDAAERGEELRLEEFLEKMEEDGGGRTGLRMTLNGTSGKQAGISLSRPEPLTGPTTMHTTSLTALRDKKLLSEERRKQMHRFFQMPTEQKVREIQEIVKFLHAQQRA
ncbi:hypothetical protein BKA83DRAFT_4203023 [Pisolithus microcarpus]|nr:hypothetical protein BKA83DRAFT_4203023 [Pisolithus microcarpus]